MPLLEVTEGRALRLQARGWIPGDRAFPPRVPMAVREYFRFRPSPTLTRDALRTSYSVTVSDHELWDLVADRISIYLLRAERNATTRRAATDIELIMDDLEAQRQKFVVHKQDEQDGPPPLDPNTWDRAYSFVRSSLEHLDSGRRSQLTAPDLFPTSMAGIDIEWEADGRELGINVPGDSLTPATYYGKDEAGHVLRGTLDTSAPNVWLLQWLTS